MTREDPSPAADDDDGCACSTDERVPRVLRKPDGREIPLPALCDLVRAVNHDITQVTVLDIRDPDEIRDGRGGTAWHAAWNVPLNADGRPQSERRTTRDEFEQKLRGRQLADGNDGRLRNDRVLFLVHCTGGGRAATATRYLQELGYRAYNGGGPDDVRQVMERTMPATVTTTSSQTEW